MQVFSKNKLNKNNDFCAHNTGKLLHGCLEALIFIRTLRVKNSTKRSQNNDNGAAFVDIVTKGVILLITEELTETEYLAMSLTKQPILSTVQGLPESIELKELISLLTTKMNLKNPTIASQPEVTQTSLLEAAQKYAGCVCRRASRFINQQSLFRRIG